MNRQGIWFIHPHDRNIFCMRKKWVINNVASALVYVVLNLWYDILKKQNWILEKNSSCLERSQVKLKTEVAQLLSCDGSAWHCLPLSSIEQWRVRPREVCGLWVTPMAMWFHWAPLVGLYFLKNLLIRVLKCLNVPSSPLSTRGSGKERLIEQSRLCTCLNISLEQI